MNPIELARKLIDIESISGNEMPIASFLRGHLEQMGAKVELEEAEPGRPNVFAYWGNPDIVLSTHTDTVPPFIPSREDDRYLYGRGACDAKGIIAAQIEAAERLRADGQSDFGLLFLVGEERNSAGATAANQRPRGTRFLINGEPTENRLAVGTKGVLRVEIEARGKAAHSAYPEMGESATEKLLDALDRLRRLPMPEDPVLGKATCNIGILQAGIAPNVIPDRARAELMYRLVASGDELFASIQAAVGDLASVTKVLQIPAVHLVGMDGIETTVVAFATDIPALPAWGQPFLLGPGSILVAHSENEYIAKSELMRAAEIYVKMVKKLKEC